MISFENPADRQRVLRATAIALVLTLALVLRLRQLDTTGLGADQSFTLNTAMRWVNGGQIPLAANKSSVGVVNPPMIEYLYAAALAIWPDILSVALLTVLSGFLTVTVSAMVAYHLFGWRTAFWTALLFSLNPWGVFYSQLIWNQTMIPAFATLALASLLLYFTGEGKNRYLILSFISAAILTQVHPASGVQLLSIGLTIVVFWRRVRLTALLAGLGLFILLFVPFILYESGVGWTDLTATLELARQPSSFSFASVLIALDLLHVQGIPATIENVQYFDNLASLLFVPCLFFALGLGWRAFRRRRDNAAAGRTAIAIFITFIWLSVPVLFYLRSSFHLQIYYIMGHWPAPFILTGLTLASIQGWLEKGTWGRFGPLLRWIVLPLPFYILLGWQLFFNIQFQDGRLEAASGELQIRQIRQLVKQVDLLAAERPDCSLVVLSAGHQVETSRLSLLSEFTSVDHILLADGGLALPLPNPCGLYLDALPGSRASNWLAQRAAPLAESSTGTGGEAWRFFELEVDQVEDLLDETNELDTSILWQNGVELFGYQRGSVTPGSPMSLILTWRVRAEPPQVVYHAGTYLLSTEDAVQVVAQSDGPGFDSIQWRPGDHFITWFDIPLPAELSQGEYTVAVAFYTWPGLERVDLVEGDNTAFLEQVQLPNGPK